MTKMCFQIYNEYKLKKDGLNLQYINNQNIRLCYIAINQNFKSIQYVNKQQFSINEYFNLCKYAIDKNIESLNYIQNPTIDIYKYVLAKNIKYLKVINI